MARRERNARTDSVSEDIEVREGALADSGRISRRTFIAVSGTALLSALLTSGYAASGSASESGSTSASSASSSASGSGSAASGSTSTSAGSSTSAASASAGASSASSSSSSTSSLEEYSWDELKKIADEIAASGSEDEALKVAQNYGLVTSDGKLDGTQTKSLVLADASTTTSASTSASTSGSTSASTSTSASASTSTSTSGSTSASTSGSTSISTSASTSGSSSTSTSGSASSTESANSITVQIAGFYHDDKSDGSGKAGITFIFKDVVDKHEMNSDDSNKGGWESSEMREWMATDLIARLPEDLQNDIVEVDKMSNNDGAAKDASSVTATSDKLWLFSLAELAGEVSRWSGDTAYVNEVLSAEGTQYQLFSDSAVDAGTSNDILTKNLDGTATKWWERSSYPCDAIHFIEATNDGCPDHRYMYATRKSGVVPGFCL